MSANLELKKQVVEEITAKIKNSKSVVLVNYKGLTVAEVTELRNNFRKANVEYKVLKNTLVRKAFNEMGVTHFDEDLNGPTAVAFGSDETGAAKIIVEAQKKLNDKISAKSAYVDGNYVNENGVKQLAAIPGREQLIAGLASALSGTIRALAVALNAIAEKNAEAAN